MINITPLTTIELERGLDAIRLSPKDLGRVEMIVCRPQSDERIVLEEAELSRSAGLLGDRWHVQDHGAAADGSADRESQITIMNSRVVALLAGEKDRWPLAGDQFYVDLDLSSDNLPSGTRLAFGSAILEVTAEPHTGCKKFAARYGADATRFVNSTVGKQLHLRGINAKVIRDGTVRVGDMVSKLGD